jgi:hypothetical protein
MSQDSEEDLDFPSDEEILKRWGIGRGTNFEVLRAYDAMVTGTQSRRRWEWGLAPDPDREALMAGLVAEGRAMMRPYVRALMANGASEPEALELLKSVFNLREYGSVQRPA